MKTAIHPNLVQLAVIRWLLLYSHAVKHRNYSTVSQDFLRVTKEPCNFHNTVSDKFKTRWHMNWPGNFK